QSPHPAVLLVNDPPHFAIDFTGGLFGIIAFFRSDRKLKELRLSLPFQWDGAEFLAHSVGLHHALCDVGSLHKIVLSSRRGLAEDRFFSNPPTEQHSDFILQF